MKTPVTREALIELEDAIRKLKDETEALPPQERLSMYKKFVLDIATAKAEMSDEERAEYGITDGLIAAAKKLDALGVDKGVVFNFFGIAFVLVSPDDGVEPAPTAGGEKKEKEKKKKSSALDVLRKK
jgi:hypothetical protein